MYSEYYSVKQALKGLQAEPDIANRDPAKIKDLFFRRLYISYSENVKPENVKLQRRQDGPGWDMEVNYEVRKELVGHLDVVGKFHADEELTNLCEIGSAHVGTPVTNAQTVCSLMRAKKKPQTT